jgi:dienelactone hydrolase
MQKQTIEYQDQRDVLEGYLAHSVPKGEKKPGILIFHAWSGRDEFFCQKAEMLAELGYVGIALDMYGKGKRGSTKEENSKLMGPFMEDRSLLRNRALAGLKMAQELPFVDSRRIAAIGFCFGGLCALDLARSGADIRGVVSFHGLLKPLPPHLKSEKIKAQILALHGHDDPMVKPADVLNFQTEMTQSNTDWQMHIYSNTMHAFTHPQANDPDFGTVYQKTSDRRAWVAAKNFLTEIFSN